MDSWVLQEPMHNIHMLLVGRTTDDVAHHALESPRRNLIKIHQSLLPSIRSMNVVFTNSNARTGSNFAAPSRSRISVSSRNSASCIFNSMFCMNCLYVGTFPTTNWLRLQIQLMQSRIPSPPTVPDPCECFRLTYVPTRDLSRPSKKSLSHASHGYLSIQSYPFLPIYHHLIAIRHTFRPVLRLQRYYEYLEYASFSTQNLPFSCIFIDFDRLRIVFLVFLSLDSNVFGTFSYFSSGFT